jgi:hypothetical protein
MTFSLLNVLKLNLSIFERFDDVKRSGWICSRKGVVSRLEF